MASALTLSLFAFALANVVIGAAVALAAPNVLKRVAGVQAVFIGVVLALAALRAPAGLLIAAIAVAFGVLVIGIALAVRLHEEYGRADAAEIDAADERSDAVERSG